MFFSKNKQITSQEYEQLALKIAKLQQDVADLRLGHDTLTTNMNSVRGLINRKLGKSELTDPTDVQSFSKDDVEKLLKAYGIV